MLIREKNKKMNIFLKIFIGLLILVGLLSFVLVAFIIAFLFFVSSNVDDENYSKNIEYKEEVLIVLSPKVPLSQLIQQENINKNDFILSYKKACEYSDLHITEKDENGELMYGGSGSYEVLLLDYIEMYRPQYVATYRALWDDCYKVNNEENLAGVRNCFHKELQKLK